MPLAGKEEFRYTDMKLPHKYMVNVFTSGSARLKRVLARTAIAVTLVTAGGLPQFATAASSWAPTLIVNTESFQTIDEGDGTTDVEVRFGGTLNEKLIWNRTESTFQFTDDLSVQGVLSGATLRVDGAADFWGNINSSGSIRADSNVIATGYLSGSTLRVSGQADVHGALNASGAIRTDSNVTINADADSNDAVLTFGSDTVSETLTWLNSTDKFQFSDDVSVTGYLSGSTLTVDGAVTLRNVTYNAPTSQGGSNTFLRNDGAGNLTWQSITVGNGSGLIMSLHPEYPNAIYFSSGSSYIGQLYGSGGTTALDNSYVWTTTRSGIQDYWISVRFRLPNNFSSWDPVKPIEFRYKTADGTASNNHLTVRMRDTAGSLVTLTNGNGLANANWTTATITGPQGAGTWTPQGYATIYVKLAALTGGNAAAGFINLNFETTTP